MSGPATIGSAGEYSIADFVGVVGERQTYEHVLYLLLSFPLGILYYVVTVVGLALGLGLSVLVVGLGILFGLVLGVRAIASFERWLANRLLDTSIPTPDDVGSASDGIVGTVKAYLRATSTWQAVVFVLLKFWLGTISFLLLVTFLGTGVELLLLPLYPGSAFDVEIAGWVVARSFETSTQRLLAVPVGAVLVLVACHVLNAFAAMNASIAESLLGPDRSESE